MRTCDFPDCDRPHNAKGLCRKHYLDARQAAYRAENPRKTLAGRPIEYEGPITCRICNQTLPHTEFYVRGPRRRTECRSCIVGRARISAERIEVADQRWMKRRDVTLRRKYGIGNAEFDALLEAQDGLCAICQQVPKAGRSHTRTGRRWTGFQIDHDHTTGAVRGLLCAPCNMALGAAETVGFDKLLNYVRNPVAGR